MRPPHPCQAEAAQPAHAQGAFWEGGTVLFCLTLPLGMGKAERKHPEMFTRMDSSPCSSFPGYPSLALSHS